MASQNNGGTIEIQLDGNVTGTATVTGTGGWQTWKTVSTTGFLTAGNHGLQLVFKGGGQVFFLTSIGLMFRNQPSVILMSLHTRLVFLHILTLLRQLTGKCTQLKE